MTATLLNFPTTPGPMGSTVDLVIAGRPWHERLFIFGILPRDAFAVLVHAREHLADGQKQSRWPIMDEHDTTAWWLLGEPMDVLLFSNED